ncbi:membrane protein insertion efficiency factor YidD [Candidatus Dependentiae bacterium]|nr:membrane protein insertion efficiency factor YidD [Candidatus Dependentiae bacterium]
MLLVIISKMFRLVLQFLIVGLRPLLGPATCIYTPSCTTFALEQLEDEPLYRAFPAIVRRVLSCISIKPW